MELRKSQHWAAITPRQRQDPNSPVPGGIWHLLMNRDRLGSRVMAGQDLTALSGCIHPLRGSGAARERGEKAMGEKSAWVFKTSGVQQVTLNGVLLTPTPSLPGTAPLPAMALLFMWLRGEPGQEADPAEKQASSKKALSEVDQLCHWPYPRLHTI